MRIRVTPETLDTPDTLDIFDTPDTPNTLAALDRALERNLSPDSGRIIDLNPRVRSIDPIPE